MTLHHHREEEFYMDKSKSNDYTVASLKRQAKQLSKIAGIRHSEALEKIAQEKGYPNWKQLIKKNDDRIEKTDTRRPEITVPVTLSYHHVLTGKVLGQRPNRKMSVKNHIKVGRFLKEIQGELTYYKKAYNIIRNIRIKMDTWLGEEYNEKELDTAKFNEIYFGSFIHNFDTIPSLRQRSQLRILLRKARGVIDKSYHDCKPLEEIYHMYDIAMSALIKWPPNIKVPVIRDKNIAAGTFIRFKTNKKVGIVLHHNYRTEIVTGYSDGGYFEAGRHEVSVMKVQPSISKFRPLRLWLPYCKCELNDGTEVLLNRDYTPIWQRLTSGEVKLIEPETYIDSKPFDWYFEDRTAPYYNNKKSLELCISILKSWGVESKNPQVLDRLPKAITERNIGLIAPKGFS